MRWKKVSLFSLLTTTQNRLSQMNNPSIKTNVAEDTLSATFLFAPPLFHGFMDSTIVPVPGGIRDLIGQTTLAATHSRLKITVSRCRDVNPECATFWQQLCNIGHHIDSAFISHEVSHETGIQDRTAC